MFLELYGGIDVVQTYGIVDFDAAHEKKLPLIPEPAHIVHELAHRHRLRKGDKIAGIHADVIVKSQPAFLPEKQRSKHRELLGDGGHMENRFR